MKYNHEEECKKLYGITMAEAHEQHICVQCQEKIHACIASMNEPGGIYSKDGGFEYGITGLCEYCFDAITSYDEEE